MAGSAMLVTVAWDEYVAKRVRRALRSNQQASKIYCAIFDDAIIAGPLLIGGMYAGGFASGHLAVAGARMIERAARRAVARSAKLPKPKIPQKPPSTKV